MAREEVIGFYDIGDENEFLSNWYVSPFELGGIRFFCMEQYMMYRKAKIFRDEEAAAAILASDDQGTIKRLGRGVKNFDSNVWNRRGRLAVYSGLLAKFSQNPNLAEQLLATGDALLAECSPTDRIWGIGISLADERRLDPDLWEGQNLLGWALMEAREMLRSGLFAGRRESGT